MRHLYGWVAQEVLHPDGDASHMHVSAILSGWDEWWGFESVGVACDQPTATIYNPYRDTKRRLRREIGM